MVDHIVNPEMIKLARAQLRGLTKAAFIPGGDSMGGGAPPEAGGMPPGDPSMGGGAPPGDPSMGGGAPPTAPPGDDLLGKILQQMTTMQQQMATMGGGAGAGGGAGGAAGGLKPKIDVNVEIMQMKNILAKICDHLGIQVPVQDMVATPEKLTAMAQGQSTSSGAGGAGGAGAIPPIDPMQGIQPAGVPGMGKASSLRVTGHAFDSRGLTDVGNRAAAVARLRRQGA